MKSHIIIPAFTLVLVAITPLAHSQTPDPAAAPPITEQSPSPSPAQSQQMEGMEKMSDSVTKMSEMCQMMMQKEMSTAPYKMAAGISVGTLLFIALVLFVILEVQWIIYWARLLKQQRGGAK